MSPATPPESVQVLLVEADPEDAARVRAVLDESVARRLLLPEDAEVLVRMAEESDVLR